MLGIRSERNWFSLINDFIARISIVHNNLLLQAKREYDEKYHDQVREKKGNVKLSVDSNHMQALNMRNCYLIDDR